MLLRSIIFLLSFLISLHCHAKDEAYIVLDTEKNIKSMTLDDRPILMKDMYNELSNVLDKKGNDIQLLILFSEYIKFGEVINMKGLAQKVGFKNIRLFYFIKETKKMVEIEINTPAVPIPPRTAD